MTVGVSEAIDIALRALLNPGDEVVDKGLGCGAGLGHFNFDLEIIPRFVAELERELVAMSEDVVQDRDVFLAREIKADLVKMLSGLFFFRRLLDRVVVESDVGQEGVGIVAGLDPG